METDSAPATVAGRKHLEKKAGLGTHGFAKTRLPSDSEGLWLKFRAGIASVPVLGATANTNLR